MTERPTRDAVAVLGHYAQLNLGDESITAATVSAVRRWRPTARIIGISLDPADTRARHGIDSYPLRRHVSVTPTEPPPVATAADAPTARSGLGAVVRRLPLLVAAVRGSRRIGNAARELLSELGSLKASWRALDGVDLVIVAGSNQLLDQFGGAMGFPYTLLRWSVMARLRGIRVVLLSVGAGPLSGGLATRFVRWTLALADYSSVRDAGSARLVQQIGWSRPVPVLPDLAFSFAPGATPGNHARADDGSLGIAVNLMPVHDPRWWPDARPEIHARYRAAMTDFVAAALKRGHRVTLFGTQPADEWVAHDLLRDLGTEAAHPRLSVTTTRSLDQLVDLYSRCDMVAATRFHGIILALRLARPVLAICYYRKSREVMREFDLERYAFDLEQLRSEQLIDGFAALAGQLDDVQTVQRHAAAERFERLETQYRHVFHPAREEAARS